MSDEQVVVVGAGMAGLVSALQLAHRGMKVTVVDPAEQPGGKIRQLMVQGAAIDSGPTVFTMRWVFEQIYASVGESLGDQVQLEQLPIIGRHAWTDGSTLDLFADPERSREAIRTFSGPEEATRFDKFCQLIRKVYDTLEGPYIRAAHPTPMSLTKDIGWQGLGVLGGLGAMPTLWQSLRQQFRDPRLVQLFGRYATYCGSSPWAAPATLMLIAQVELDGVWSVRGGIHALVKNLEKLALQRGVTFRYGTWCQRINTSQGRVCGVTLQNGEVLRADKVVFNGDAQALRSGLLGQEVTGAVPSKSPTRSLSAMTWSVYARTSGFELDRHNIFFQNNYAREFEDIFAKQRLPQQPTVYVCAQDRGTDTQPTDKERLLCLINAPAVGDSQALTQETLQACQTQTFSMLQNFGLSVHAGSQDLICTSPQDFAQRFPATGGALYGQATHGWMAAFARPYGRSQLPGLYLAGGSIHPGPGMPMAALSGRMAVEALMADRNSTKRFHPAATYGGTLTQ